MAHSESRAAEIKQSPVSSNQLSLQAKELFIEELTADQPGGPRSIYTWELSVREAEMVIKLDHSASSTIIVINGEMVKQFAGTQENFPIQILIMDLELVFNLDPMQLQKF